MKKITIIVTICILIIILLASKPLLINCLFSSQYNENGISHFLVITIDKNQPREFVGELENHKVYVENLDLKETNFRTINAENMSIKEAIENKLVSIKDWENHAFKIQTEENKEILINENYEIVISNDECIIRPLI